MRRSYKEKERYEEAEINTGRDQERICEDEEDKRK